MQDRNVIIALVVLVAILVVLYWAYDQCRLDPYLAPERQKCGTGGGSFVGAMAQHPRLVPCAFQESPTWMMNRCNYT